MIGKAFWFHYNKPASKAAGHPVLTLHYEGACHLVRSVTCEVPTHTRERQRQPHVVVAGVGYAHFSGDHVVITEGG